MKLIKSQVGVHWVISSLRAVDSLDLDKDGAFCQKLYILLMNYIPAKVDDMSANKQTISHARYKLYNLVLTLQVSEQRSQDNCTN